MDSFHIDMNGQDSCQNRSRSNNIQPPSLTTQFRGLNILNSSNPTRDCHHPSLSSRATFEARDEHRRSSPSSSFIPAPVAQQTTPFPNLSQDNFDWTFNQTRETQSSARLLRLDPAQSASITTSDRAPLFEPTSHPADMSAVGIQQYDSRFDAGIQGLRQSYTWPNFDMNINQQFFQVPSPNMNGSVSQVEESKLIPMYSRSISSSPPRGSLSPEQRELKRQRDFARRDSKSRVRRDRSTSNPYIISQHGSPNLVPGTIPEYTGSLSPSPLLSQASPAMSSSSFLAPFPAQIVENGQTDLYAPVFTMGPNDFTSPAYNIPYSDPIAILPTQTYIPRPHSLSTSSDHQIYHPQPSPQHQHHISTTAKLESGDHIRLLPGRPKPQCWEHGCNGRQFSTFSNLLRHQREKSGAASKSSCPHCGAEFTRTTARNGHMAHEKCKQQRRNS